MQLHRWAHYIANQLVTPSYISLERALSIHGIIPERVPLIQSVRIRILVERERNATVEL